MRQILRAQAQAAGRLQPCDCKAASNHAWMLGDLLNGPIVGGCRAWYGVYMGMVRGLTKSTEHPSRGKHLVGPILRIVAATWPYQLEKAYPHEF